LTKAEDTTKLAEDIFHLARLALAGRPQDVQLHVRRLARRYKTAIPGLSERLAALLRDVPSRSSPLRGKTGSPSLPVDMDSRLELIRVEPAPEVEVEPVFRPDVQSRLNQIIQERRERGALHAEGLEPTRSVLFTGPPGVGKTLAARWIARELGLPLLVLDLSAVMSSFLGRTGNNLRYVLDYAKNLECVLLFDELDAIAKRRDDATEIGELKRLVTVLLQEVDDWPADSLLIAATNHPDLLDPAAWRRFELIVDFPMPDADAISTAVKRFVEGDPRIGETWLRVLESAFEGASFSDMQRCVLELRRATLLENGDVRGGFERVVGGRIRSLPWKRRIELARTFSTLPELSQRLVHELTGVSREKIRKDSRELAGVDGAHDGGRASP
jgi:SpoVK/Ycf46/Vps4 family AAA+-type ATPase